MEELKDEELKKIDGGFEISIGALALISFGIPFVVGFVDGFTRPLACN